MPSLTHTLFALIRRELRLALLRPGELLEPLIFFVIVISLFPLAVSPKPALLTTIAPGIIWVAILLATLISLNRLFQDDYLDGTLQQILLSPQPKTLLILTKVLCHWLMVNGPLILVTPLLVMMLNLPGHIYPVLYLSLLLGSLSITFLGAIGAALTISLRNGHLLLALIVLPLCIPIIIFSTGALNAAIHATELTAALYFLGAISAAAVTFCPIMIVTALKIGVQ